VSWTGFYIGGHVGGAWSEVDWSNISLTGERFNKTESGFIGGGQIGYNQQFGNVVLGVEATLSGADLSRDFRSILFPTVNFRADLKTIATVTGRFGLTSNSGCCTARPDGLVHKSTFPAETRALWTAFRSTIGATDGHWAQVSNTRSRATSVCESSTASSG